MAMFPPYGTRLGKISESKVPSALDAMPKNKSWVPPPGAYYNPEAASFALPEGGRLNRNPPRERLVVDDFSYPKPSPGQYGIPSDPSRPRQINGQFSRDHRITKFIYDEEMRSKQVPAPGAHAVHESMEALKPFCPDGGRYITWQHKPAGYFDTVPKLSEDNPAPGAYEVPSALQTNRAVGRLVYRYESATLQDTKAIVAKAVSDSDTAPGPGTYDLPDVPPLGQAPMLRGRPTVPAHPFAANLAPDSSQKFSALQPVRQQNNAEQIFGTGVRRGSAEKVGAAPRRSSTGSRPGSAGGDQVNSKDLPQGNVPNVYSEEDPDVVQWKSGGFSVLKKSRSTGHVKQPMHPSMEAMKQFYPNLSRKYQRNEHIFLPMASRRSESVPTHNSCDEYQRLQRGKWQLKAYADGIVNFAAAALEPLDEERLKAEAMVGIRDKALDRLAMEGVQMKQRDLVLQQIDALLGFEAAAFESAAMGESPSQMADMQMAIDVLNQPDEDEGEDED